MKKQIFWVTLVIAFIAGSPVQAQDSLVDHLIDACENDIKSYCSQVTPGNGRMLHCMAAHEDKISGQCVYAFYQAATVLEQLSTAIAYFAQECQTEIQTLCSDVEFIGNGELLACLDEKADQVDEGCKKAIADTVGE